MAEFVTITEEAKQRLNQIAHDHNEQAIKIFVTTKGCSGYSYGMDFTDPDSADKFDTVINLDSAKIVIDAGSMLFLMGTTLDWKEDSIQSHFVWQNPNEAARCGCGESFSV